jgi:hypothetical protein
LKNKFFVIITPPPPPQAELAKILKHKENCKNAAMSRFDVDCTVHGYEVITNSMPFYLFFGLFNDTAN